MTDDALEVSPYEHLRRADADAVYRVVGESRGTVTLLRVTDERGRRRATGEVVTLEHSTVEAEFERAPNPDAGIRPVAWLRNLVSGLVWELRHLTGL